MPEIEQNPQTALARNYVLRTGVNVFLTGKAGTGKTTFLRSLTAELRKNFVVLAPTGVAAVNARGVTIHSFFQLPFCPYLPDVKELVTEYQMPEHKLKLRKSRIDMIRALDLVIIDEISMVRADLLDAVDHVLRRYRGNQKPFGGVQLLLIGDLRQLSPVVTESERPYLERVYPSPYFFSAKALQKVALVTVTLQKVYRQQDPTFVNLLNKVRDNQLDAEALELLNRRYNPSFDPDASPYPDFIRLTTHNAQADRINQQKMRALKGRSYFCQATVEGTFPDSFAATERSLELKVGARVMFLKNDSSGQRRYYNGLIGTITKIVPNPGAEGGDYLITVRADGQDIDVPREQWENVRYDTDPQSHQIVQKVDGTFTQYPLRLAWAVTIHKAQGLTFDHVIIDAAAAFAFGQVYVALSRCRSYEGLVLSSPISPSCLRSDGMVSSFEQSMPTEDQSREQLPGCELQYFYDQLSDLLDFSRPAYLVERVSRVLAAYSAKNYAQQLQLLQTKQVALEQLCEVRSKFLRSLVSVSASCPPGSEYVNDRFAKSVAYYAPIVSEVRHALDPVLNLDLDNKQVSRDFASFSDPLKDLLAEKAFLLKVFSDHPFDVERYHRARAEFLLREEQKAQRRKSSGASSRGTWSQEKDLNPLAAILRRWRKSKSEELQVPPFQIFSNKVIDAIVEALPRTLADLRNVAGIGVKKISTFGEELLKEVNEFCAVHGMEPLAQPEPNPEPAESPAPPTPEDSSSAEISLALYNRGYSIPDIARSRNLSTTTIESHLLAAAKVGQLNIEGILGELASEELVEYFDDHLAVPMKEVYEHFQGTYTYFELRLGKELCIQLKERF